MKRIVIVFYLPKVICNHVLGENHSFEHRCFVGLIVALFGVIIAITAGEFHSKAIHVVGDFTGYALHAIGLFPFIEGIAKASNKDKKDEK